MTSPVETSRYSNWSMMNIPGHPERQKKLSQSRTSSWTRGLISGEGRTQRDYSSVGPHRCRPNFFEVSKLRCDRTALSDRLLFERRELNLARWEKYAGRCLLPAFPRARSPSFAAALLTRTLYPPSATLFPPFSRNVVVHGNCPGAGLLLVPPLVRLLHVRPPACPFACRPPASRANQASSRSKRTPYRAKKG